jgi:DNA-directed RNA polymerase subunit RPC12/RpoP
MAKYKYHYECPQCGTQLELKMRVTQTKRRCPRCGTPITPEEIDQQEEERRRRLRELHREINRQADEEELERRRRQQKRQTECLIAFGLVVGLFLLVLLCGLGLSWWMLVQR